MSGDTFEIPCPRCNGTGTNAGGDCPECRIDGFPTGVIEVQRTHRRPRAWWDKDLRREQGQS